jgi:O-antigen/teichoic acid export membrane protein
MFFKTFSKVGSVQVLTAIQGLLFTFLAARLLSPEMFGELRYVLVLLPFLMVSTLPTFDILVLREAASASKINLQDIVKKRGQFGFFGALFFAFILFFTKDNFTSEVFQSLCIVLLILPFYETTTSFRNFLVGKGLRDRALTIQLRNRILSIVLILLGVFIYMQLAPSVAGFLFIFLVCTTFPNIITNFSLKLREESRESKYLKTSDSLVKEAVFTSLASVIWIASYSFDKLIIERQLGVESLAFYSILVMIPLMIAQLVDGLIMLYYKKIFLSKVSIFTIKNIVSVVFLFSIVICAYGYFVHIFYPSIFGDFYSYTLSLALLSGVLILTGSIELLLIQYLYKEKKPSLIMGYNCSSILVLFVTLTLMLKDLNLHSILLVLGIKQIFLPMIIFTYHRLFQNYPHRLGSID